LQKPATAAAKSVQRHARTLALGLAAALAAASGAQAQATFATTPVGTATGQQSVTVTAQVAGTVNSVSVLTLGMSGLDFAPGSGAVCKNETLAVGGTCTQSVIFTPTNPGLRMGAVVLLDSSSNVLGAAYISGTGSGGLGVLVAGNVLPVAGDGNWILVHDGNLATKAELYLPAGVAVDGAGNIYIADSLHNRVRMVCATGTSATISGISCTAGAGTILTVAGNGNSAYTGDGGLSTSATVNSPGGVAVDGAGNLYIADTGNNVIRMVTAATGIITTVAGGGTTVTGGGTVCTGQTDTAGDGCSPTSAVLNAPWGVTPDASGNLYIADTANHRIRMVSVATGLITTVAGSGFTNTDGSGGFSGDGSAATSAELNRPFTVAFDASGNMYIPDSANNRIRKVNTSGVISTFAGTGTAGFAVDGTAANLATLWSPSGVAVDAAGNVYIADTQNNAIRKVSSASSATPGVISTPAKNTVGKYYFSGAFTTTALYGPIGISLDGSGNLFVADYFDQIVRKIQGNFAALSYTTTIRQGSQSATQNKTIENDGNAALDLTDIVPATNAALDSSTTTCAADSSLVLNGTCVIGAIFAPAKTPVLTSNQTETPTITVADEAQTGVVGSNSPLDIQLVGIAAPVNGTTISVTSDLNPSGYGKTVTFTATVVTGSTTGNLTGTVSFYDLYNGVTKTLATSVALNSANTTSTATFATSSLGVGDHTITAAYSGDTIHFASTSTDDSATPWIQTVQETTATTLKSSVNPSTVGQSVIFTATVTLPSGGGYALDGTVTFTNSGALLCSSQAISTAGVATCTTAALPQGVNQITAVYTPVSTSYIVGSTSNVVAQDVQASSSIAVASSLPVSNYGDSVIFTATITPTGTVAATGTVKFLDAGVQIGTGTLVGTTNQATFTTSSLAVGNHAITVTYAGDNNNGASSSAAITQTVSKAQTSTTEAANPSTGIAGAAEAITATVKTIAGAAITTGTVTFTGAGATAISATLTSAGTATIKPVLAPGTYSIVATYGGGSNDGSSTSVALPLTVVQATTQTAVTATPSSALVLGTVTFKATVTGNGGIPTGSVTFYANGTQIGALTALTTAGTATITYAGLAAGSYTITAVYGGDTNDLTSTGTAALVVGKIPTTTDLGSSTTTGTNPQVILVATVLTSNESVPTGTVTFNNGSTALGIATLNSSGVATLTPDLSTGTYTVVAVYSGDLQYGASTSSSLTVSSTSTGFNLTVTPATLSMAASQNATVAVTLTSNNGFADTIGLGCASLPSGVTCHFTSPSTSLVANGVQTVQLTIDTNNPLSGGSSAMNRPAGNQGAYLAGMFLPFSAFFGWIFWRFRKRQMAALSMVLVLILSGAALLATGCSGFTMSTATPGTYVIQVTGTGANSDIIHYQNVTLTITK
jgi:hypothetical protein